MSKPPLPKEHGAWAMLIVPLLLGSAIAPKWHWRILVVVVAAFAMFLVRYPLAMLVKLRKRASASKQTYMVWAAIYGLVCALSGGWLIIGQHLWWLILFGIGGILLIGLYLWLVSQRQEMSVLGELSAIVGLAFGAPMAYYAASGQLDKTALILWLVNVLYFGGTVFYIKLKVRQQPRQPPPDLLSQRLIKAKACLAYQALALLIIIVLVAYQQAPILLLLVLVPATIKVFIGAWRWQDKRSLNMIRLGIAEIVHALTFTGLMVLAF